jgi:hypothetical protein
LISVGFFYRKKPLIGIPLYTAPFRSISSEKFDRR